MQEPRIAGEPLRFAPDGSVRARTPWREALARLMDFYRTCPMERGYPRFACETFLDAGWRPDPAREDIIPAMQNGTGIHSFLAYRELAGDADGWLLDVATRMGLYLIHEALTPDGGAWPRIARSTGRRGRFPQPPDCGAQSDRPHEIEPDKAALAAGAWLRLHAAGAGEIFLEHALHTARVLAGHQRAGDARRSPFPFRVDHRDGAARGEVSGNMGSVLRLYGALQSRGFAEFAPPHNALWDWIVGEQLPSAAGDGALFAQFFEDHDTPGNRAAWAPLTLARDLLRHAPAGFDAIAAAGTLLGFVDRHFTHREFGVTVCHEQDEDRQAWNGVNSTYGAVLAAYARATGSAAHARRGRDALNFSLYCIDALGRPRDLFTRPEPGGWQEDALTDVVHNVVDALAVCPEWADPA